ncbi:hypothetical protein RRG08_004315 [Elysia crispata]|uniref:Uncharacterized protein n=1 Tax=Elysia crispata TaxID=231223 RepID=A0AAE1CW94_9GAST|nr:hypothetical protein RRG08_004315 [Elysia crispata]
MARGAWKPFAELCPLLEETKKEDVSKRTRTWRRRYVETRQKIDLERGPAIEAERQTTQTTRLIKSGRGDTAFAEQQQCWCSGQPCLSWRGHLTRLSSSENDRELDPPMACFG